MKDQYKDWLRANYVYLLTIPLFIIFKLMFPYPDLFSDSVNYLQWGFDHYTIMFRPMGYTDFLMFFNGWGGNHLTIVVIQFLVFVVSSYYFLETLFALFHPSQAIKWLCWVAIIFNPLSYFLINLVSPDCFFISLSALWFATLLRFIFFEKHRYVFLGVHLLSLVILFSLRYNAQYYPFFAIGILLICNMKMKLKLLGAVTNLAVFFMLYTMAVNHAEKNFGVSIMSGFGGWIMANNAIHIYNVTHVDSNIFDELEEQMLHKVAMLRKDSAYNYKENPRPTDQYMWSFKGPLKLYQNYKEKRGLYTNHVHSWWGESVMFKHYGITLIENYPLEFIKAFYLPNFKEFFYPNPEVLTSYNFNKIQLQPAWMEYLGIKGNNNVLASEYSGLQKNTIAAIIVIYAALTPFCMLFCVIVIAMYVTQLIRTKFKVTDERLFAAFALSLFYIVTTLLLVFAHPVLLRYISLLLIFFNIIPFIAYKVLMNRKAAPLKS